MARRTGHTPTGKYAFQSFRSGKQASEFAQSLPDDARIFITARFRSPVNGSTQYRTVHNMSRPSRVPDNLAREAVQNLAGSPTSGKVPIRGYRVFWRIDQ